MRGGLGALPTPGPGLCCSAPSQEGQEHPWHQSWWSLSALKEFRNCQGAGKEGRVSGLWPKSLSGLLK